MVLTEPSIPVMGKEVLEEYIILLWTYVIHKILLQSFLNVDMYQNRVKRVECRYQVCVLEEQVVLPSAPQNNSKYIFWCNPTYRKKPWFDWVMVDYAIGCKTISILSHLLMLILHTQQTSRSINNYICLYALVYYLWSSTTPQYSDLDIFKGDRMYHEAKLFNFNNSISDTVFVLPTIERSSPFSSLKNNIFSNLYFVVLPQT